MVQTVAPSDFGATELETVKQVGIFKCFLSLLVLYVFAPATYIIQTHRCCQNGDQ